MEAIMPKNDSLSQLLSEQDALQRATPDVQPARSPPKSQEKKLNPGDEDKGTPGLGGRGGDFEDGARGGQR
jgi:hypothetical protein